MTTVRLSPELDQRLAALVKEAGHSKAFYVREAVAQYIEDLEDIYIATKRLQEMDREWTLEELQKGLDNVDG